MSYGRLTVYADVNQRLKAEWQRFATLTYNFADIADIDEAAGIASYGLGIMEENYWSVVGSSVSVGNATTLVADTTVKVDGETVTWTTAMTNMNNWLEANQIQWRYAINTGSDAETCPLILVAAESSQ